MNDDKTTTERIKERATDIHDKAERLGGRVLGQGSISTRDINTRSRHGLSRAWLFLKKLMGGDN